MATGGKCATRAPVRRPAPMRAISVKGHTDPARLIRLCRPVSSRTKLARCQRVIAHRRRPKSCRWPSGRPNPVGDDGHTPACRSPPDDGSVVSGTVGAMRFGTGSAGPMRNMSGMRHGTPGLPHASSFRAVASGGASRSRRDLTVTASGQGMASSGSSKAIETSSAGSWARSIL